MWNLLFYVKADQPGKEYNYCVMTTLQPMFDVKALLDSHNVVVQAKRRCPQFEVPTPSVDEGLTWKPTPRVFFDGQPRIYRVRDHADLEAVRDKAPHASEAEMASATAMASFLDQALNSPPEAAAAPICLGFWSHAGGWADPMWMPLGFLRETAQRPPKNLLKDFMSLPALQSGIRAGLQRAGRQSVDIVAFNSCLMGCVEAAYELRRVARYLVASEAAIPYTQWNQRAWLEDVGKAPTMGVSDLIKSLLSSFNAKPDDDVCISALDLGEIEGLVTEMATFVELSAGFSSTTWSQIGSARDSVPTLGWHNSVFDVLTVDIVDLFNRIAKRCKNPAAVDQATKVIAAHKKVVVDSRPVRPDRNGVSVFFPATRSDFTRLAWGSRYEPEGKETAAFVKASGWNVFLERYWKAARRP